MFLAHIGEICTKETSADPDGWTPENPLWGHCAIVAALIHEIYGGDIVRASLLHIPCLVHVRSHYANKLQSGALIDATAAQFGDKYPVPLVFVVSSYEHVLDNTQTFARYRTLRRRHLNLTVRLSEKEPHKEKLPIPRRNPKK